MVTSAVTPSLFSTSSTLCMLVSDFAGFVRAVPRIEPPRRWMAFTSSIVSFV